MKKKILIISGGISKERIISLETGRQVAKELKKNNYRVKICEPDKDLISVTKSFKPHFIFNALATCLPVSKLITLSLEIPPEIIKIFFFNLFQYFNFFI